eukprot:Mycagemm_TRINITY_DN10037_c0_g1::TRINITY_DN10037_c0_g1_i2::g.2175::m.2175 type:complete len:132 gc:universal TRINITY_DN10037_c0_g1_i2:526-131(-)
MTSCVACIGRTGLGGEYSHKSGLGWRSRMSSASRASSGLSEVVGGLSDDVACAKLTRSPSSCTKKPSSSSNSWCPHFFSIRSSAPPAAAGTTSCCCCCCCCCFFTPSSFGFSMSSRVRVRRSFFSVRGPSS